jgi:exodeoxyribonuclease V beta subunit
MMDGQPLQVCEAPLSGISLIEASAGTGKTRTITDLYVRLILETARQVNQILVVTFTVAATAELRDRLRRRLVAAYEAFRGLATEDEFCRQLLRSYPHRQVALQRLDDAMQGFDEAAVYTIHGFCERVLADRAFESGMPFTSDILPDERELLQEVVDDFWRRELYNASPLFVGYLLDAGWSPEQFLAVIRQHVGKSYLRLVRPEPDAKASGEGSGTRIETAFVEAYQEVRAGWQTSAADVEQLLMTSQALNRNRYRPGSIPKWTALLGDYLALETPHPTLCDSFDRFTTRGLAQAVKKGQQPPRHDFFTLCDRLASAHDQLTSSYAKQLQTLEVALFDYCQRELRQRKRRRQLLSYDDLLVNLDQALAGGRGQELATAIRNRFTAALIDEFQDTDPVQYRIFRRIYHGTDAAVFFVGDPKQAIYSFRGADIFAYFRASRDTERRYTLEVNRRSDADLIRAVNTLFKAARRPFLFDDITFRPVRPAPHRSDGFTENGSRISQLRVWFLDGEDNQKVSRSDAEALATQATAAEIARLLNLGARGEAHIGDRPLEGGDIAVLVRSHRQGRRIRDELQRRRVSSVQLGQDNVFASWEAMELERVLGAVANPADESLLRGALATVMCGATGERIHGFYEDEQAWEDRVTTFHEYHRLWRAHGFARMFRSLVSREQIERRLLAFQDGERRLTNLMHLAELLQAAADRQRTGMEGLLKWLAERRRTEAAEDEEAQLRLESDEHLVKIVTIHKSKGLEYPLVFCPFLWSEGRKRGQHEPLVFHDPDDAYQAVLDLSSESPAAWQTQARTERCAENLRLLYVALTRARHCCYIVWGAIRDVGTSSLAWLLHQPEEAAADLTMDAVAAHVNSRCAADLWTDLQRWAAQANGGIRLEPLPTDTEASYQPPSRTDPPLAARRFPWPLGNRWRVTSFSALASGTGVELPDYDAAAPSSALAPQPPELRTVFTFPRGVRAGRCLHAIFERLDFTRQDRDGLEALVERCLVEHGFEADWTPVIGDMVQRVLATPLDEARCLALGDIPADRRLVELEFYYPLTELTCQGLYRLLAAHGGAAGLHHDDIEPVAFAPLRGYMKGFIDLVFEAHGRFYVADYKSNWLGGTVESYRPESLRQVMRREAYYLQYLIYTLAAHRYLRLRLPAYDYDTHFGGVFYLFIRGMDPDCPDCGIFRDRPSKRLVEALDAYLDTGSSES